MKLSLDFKGFGRFNDEMIIHKNGVNAWDSLIFSNEILSD